VNNGGQFSGGNKGITVTANGGTIDTNGLSVSFPMTGVGLSGASGARQRAHCQATDG